MVKLFTQLHLHLKLAALTLFLVLYCIIMISIFICSCLISSRFTLRMIVNGVLCVCVLQRNPEITHMLNNPDLMRQVQVCVNIGVIVHRDNYNTSIYIFQ